MHTQTFSHRQLVKSFQSLKRRRLFSKPLEKSQVLESILIRVASEVIMKIESASYLTRSKGKLSLKIDSSLFLSLASRTAVSLAFTMAMEVISAAII